MVLYLLVLSYLSLVVTAATHKPRVSLDISLSGHLPTPQTYTLTCEPVGGDHPDPAKACDALNLISGDLDSFHSLPFPCRITHLPAVQVDITGTYYEKPVQFTKTHANYKCVRAVMSGLYP